MLLDGTHRAKPTSEFSVQGHFLPASARRVYFQKVLTILGNSAGVMEGSGRPVTQQFQPVRTSQLMFRAKSRKSGLHVCVTSYWLIPSKIFKISNGPRSLMTSCISCCQMKPKRKTRKKKTRLILLLDSDSTHLHFRQMTQYHMMTRSKLVRKDPLIN